MDTMVKNTRLNEVFASTKNPDKIFNTNNTFYCSTNPGSPQLLNRQKNDRNSFKSLSNIEKIELETLRDPTNDIYTFNKNKDRRTSLVKKDMTEESFRESDYFIETDECSSKPEKPQKSLSFQVDKPKTSVKPKKEITNPVINQTQTTSSSNNLNKLTKQKSEIQSSSNILNSFGSNSLITSKLNGNCDKNKKDKKSKKSKSKNKEKYPNKKAYSSQVNIHSTENSLMGDMFRNSELNSNKLQLKMNRHDGNSYPKPIIKKPNNSIKSDKLNSPEKENIETLRWKYELDDPVEESKRIEVYKQNRRRRYIEQRNKYLILSNVSSSNFLPYLYYENVEKPPTPPVKIELESDVELVKDKEPLNASNLTEAENLENILETNKSRNSESQRRVNIIDNDKIKQIEGKMKSKDHCSNVTTDSAISSMSSASQ